MLPIFKEQYNFPDFFAYPDGSPSQLSPISGSSTAAPCSRVLPEKRAGPHLVNKFLALYETRRFITAITRSRHLSQSSARSFQSISNSTLFKIRYQFHTASRSFPLPHRKILTARMSVHLSVEAQYELDPSMGVTWILNISSDINGTEVATRDLNQHHK